MNMYTEGACEPSYLQQLYDACGEVHTTATETPSYLNELYVEDCHAQHIADNCTPTVTPVVTPVVDGCSSVAVCTATGATSAECAAQKLVCASSGKTVVQELYPEWKSTPVVPIVTPVVDGCSSVAVCTATGANSTECAAQKLVCASEGKTTDAPVIVVKDAATKCPAAVSVCTSAGETSAPCTAAKEACVASLM
jgi:hypothetical protein